MIGVLTCPVLRRDLVVKGRVAEAETPRNPYLTRLMSPCQPYGAGLDTTSNQTPKLQVIAMPARWNTMDAVRFLWSRDLMCGTPRQARLPPIRSQIHARTSRSSFMEASSGVTVTFGLAYKLLSDIWNALALYYAQHRLEGRTDRSPSA